DPEWERPRYGNDAWNGSSFASTPSPSVLVAQLLSIRQPSTTFRATSRMSSDRRRPFGKPARSPPMTPSVLQLVVQGGIVGFRRSSSLACTTGGWFNPGSPVRDTGTRSQLRSIGGVG